MPLPFIILFSVAGLVIAIGLVLNFWPKTGKWGINLSKVNCPKCGTPLPMIRKPQNKTQMMWGGWTCPNCGSEVDKYGKERKDFNS